MNFTPIVRPFFVRRADASLKCHASRGEMERCQRKILAYLLRQGAACEYGKKYGLGEITPSEDIYSFFTSRIPVVEYEDIRDLTERMVRGEKNILWPGVTRRFAQSSGTSGGKSKYIPVTEDSLRFNHYRGGLYTVAHYLRLYPDSRIFAGKGFILGGSFANEVKDLPAGVKVGDLSANLIEGINPLANLVRVPARNIALMADWQEKLPALVKASMGENVTNISGVPSWFMTVIKEVMRAKGAEELHQVWPDLEVFFHGGISFEPYRMQYDSLIDSTRMRYMETYNASEGFFAMQCEREPGRMMLMIDGGIFYEFIPLEDYERGSLETVPVWKVEQGRTYVLVISSCNGLWRYMPGDTVKIECTEPYLGISIAGRTKCFINAFGEELMVHNAEAAIAETCRRTGAAVENFTAGPVFAAGANKGYHRWLIEWSVRPESVEKFADILDEELQKQNSDYQAKRSHGIFLSRLEITEAPAGLFERWLAATGKLGGQRKVPRLSNDPGLIDRIINI